MKFSIPFRNPIYADKLSNATLIPLRNENTDGCAESEHSYTFTQPKQPNRTSGNWEGLMATHFPDILNSIKIKIYLCTPK